MSPSFRRLIARRGERIRRLLIDGGLPPSSRRLVTSRLRHAVGRPRRRRAEVKRAAAHGERASAVVDRLLRERGVDVFVAGFVDDVVELGIPVGQRAVAACALAELGSDGDERWAATWRYGPVSHATTPRRLATAGRAAQSWRLERGADPAARDVVELCFWELGPSRRLERIGVRGLERIPVDDPHTIETIDGHDYRGRAAIPVTKGLHTLRDPVDVVYTWVDSSDPAWIAAFDAWVGGVAGASDRRAAHESRFRTNDELRYSLRSLARYLPWVRSVYVVTAGQVPDWLRPDDRLRVVDHREILPAEALPTFNSQVIEAHLHRVDGLAEHFIYFNDDFFVARPLTKEHFFEPNGLIRVFESRGRIEHDAVNGAGTDDVSSVDVAAANGRALIEEAFGRRVEFKLAHAPYPLRRSAMEAVAARWPDRVDAMSAHRVRHPDDLAIASGLAQHLAWCSERAVFGDLRTDYVDLQNPHLAWYLDRFMTARDLDAFCINDTDRPCDDLDAAVAHVRRFLDERFPWPSPWES